MSRFQVAVEMLVVAGVAAFIILLLSGCSIARHAGLIQMSDEWCAAHPEATVDRCAVRSAINNAAKVN